MVNLEEGRVWVDQTAKSALPRSGKIERSTRCEVKLMDSVDRLGLLGHQVSEHHSSGFKGRHWHWVLEVSDYQVVNFLSVKPAIERKPSAHFLPTDVAFGMALPFSFREFWSGYMGYVKGQLEVHFGVEQGSTQPLEKQTDCRRSSTTVVRLRRSCLALGERPASGQV